MTKVAVRTAEVYKELRSLIAEVRGTGFEKYESYKRLISALDELALALHRMLYLDEKLDPESEKIVVEALKPPIA
ncbi:MAG: hypothetical protein AOA66_0989 [Candidatus Bathyarchaeota archaeon BA2]|nr:MAG: hypothetical protein AOA66_0989 [Candidatus Bathyarchaeota archaeon BA2]